MHDVDYFRMIGKVPFNGQALEEFALAERAMAAYDYPHPEFRLDDVQVNVLSITRESSDWVPAGDHAICYGVRVGSGTIAIREPVSARVQEVMLRPGDVVVLHGLNPHRLTSGDPKAEPTHEPWEVIQIKAPSSAVNVMNDSSACMALTKGRDDRPLRHIWVSINAMLEEYTDSPALPWRADILRRLAEVLNINITRALALENSVTSGAFADERIFRTIAAVSNDLAHPWSLKELAAMAGMSRTAFAVRYRDLVGSSPARGVCQMRTRNAALLLQKGGERVDAIALRVGYKSATPFIRAFKREFGVTPAQWRKNRMAQIS